MGKASDEIMVPMSLVTKVKKAAEASGREMTLEPYTDNAQSRNLFVLYKNSRGNKQSSFIMDIAEMTQWLDGWICAAEAIIEEGGRVMDASLAVDVGFEINGRAGSLTLKGQTMTPMEVASLASLLKDLSERFMAVALRVDEDDEDGEWEDEG